MVQIGIQRAADHLGGDAATRRREEPAGIDPVQQQHHVGRLGRGHRVGADAQGEPGQMQRVVGGKDRGALQVGGDTCAEQLRESHAPIPALARARRPPHQDHRPLGCDQEIRGASDSVGGGGRRLRRSVPIHRRDIRLDVERELLQSHVQADVDRPLRRRTHAGGGAQHALHQRGGRTWLVVPLHAVTQQCALILHRVNPIDPRAPLGRVAGPVGAHDQHGRAIAPGVECPEQPVHQSYVGVQRDSHRAVRGLGIAVGDREGVILMQAQQHLRIPVSEIVDKAVVEAAIARTGIQRDVLDTEASQHLGRHVASPTHASIAAAGGAFDPLSCAHLYPLALASRRVAGTVPARYDGIPVSDTTIGTRKIRSLEGLTNARLSKYALVVKLGERVGVSESL